MIKVSLLGGCGRNKFSRQYPIWSFRTLHNAIAAIALAVAVVVTAAFNANAQLTGDYNGFNYNVSSLAQTDWALSTSGTPNPNNIGRYSTAGNSWNLMGYRLESRIKLKASDDKAERIGLDGISALIHPRFYADLGPQVDGNLPNVNLFGGLQGGNYPGNGWMVQTLNINEWMLDLPEAYVDLSKAGFNLRLGKQRIVWSPMLFVRVLDCVDALDYRRHSIWGPVYEGFDDQRIGQWTANLTYQIPEFSKVLTKSSLQAFISPDFEPVIYPAKGSAYNMFASPLVFNNADSIATARHKLVYGAAWMGTLFKFVDASLNFVSTPQINGVSEYSLATGPGAVFNGTFGTPYLVDTTGGFTNYKQWGDAGLRNKILGKHNGGPFIGGVRGGPWWNIANAFNLPVAGLGSLGRNPLGVVGLPLDVAVTDVYPRVFIFGGSIGHYFERINAEARLEVTYTPDKQFRWLWMPAPVKDGELSIAGMFKKKFDWGVESISPTTLQFEYWYKSRSDFFDRYASNYEERDLPYSFFMVDQPLMGEKLRFNNTVMLDASQGGGAWVQPGLRFMPSDHWAYEAFYNYFWGGQRDMFGEFSSFDEVFMRVTYRF